jgi:hypothetical protein
MVDVRRQRLALMSPTEYVSREDRERIQAPRTALFYIKDRTVDNVQN